MGFPFSTPPPDSQLCGHVSGWWRARVRALIDARRPLDARSLYLEFAEDSKGRLRRRSEASEADF